MGSTPSKSPAGPTECTGVKGAKPPYNRPKAPTKESFRARGMLSFRPAHARESNGRAYLRVYAPAIFGVLRSNTPHNYYASLQGSLGIAGLEARHFYRTLSLKGSGYPVL